MLKVLFMLSIFYMNLFTLKIRELVNACEKMYEFKAGGVRPKKASGLHLLLIVYITF